MAGNHTLGTIRGSIEIDYDGAGIVRAIKDTDRLKRQGPDLDNSASRVLSSFGKLSKGAIGVAGAANLVHGAITGVAGVLAVVGPLAAAAFATAPALILGFASALVIAKIAVANVGDAMKSAGEGGAKFDKAMAKLSPQAQKFVLAYKKVLPVLDGVKKGIQDSFFKGAPEAVGKVVNGIASLKPQASGVAFALGQIAQNIVKTATNNPNIEKLRGILSGVNAFLLQIKRSIGPVVTGFINLASQASGFGGQIGESLNGALAKLSIWLNNINLADLFAAAKPIISGLVETLKNIGSIIGSIFGGITADGGSVVGILGELTAKLAAFLKSAEGQSALTALGQALKAIGDSAGQVFLELLKQLAPIIVSLAPGVAQLAGQIAGILVPALQILGPLLNAVATFLSANVGWIGPLVTAVVALAGAYKVIAIATGIWSAAQAILDALLIANPIGLVVAAIAVLIGVIVLIATKTTWFQTVWKAVWGGIKAAAKVVADWFMGTVVPSFMKSFNQIKGIILAYLGVWRSVWNIVRTVVTAVWNVIVAYIRGQINQVKNIINGIRVVIAIIRNAFNSAKSAAQSAISGIVSLVRSLPGRAVSALGNLGRLLYSKGRSLVQGFISGIASMIGAVADKARSVVSAVTRFLPGSPAKEGPLSGKGYALLRARRMMADLAQGMEDGSQWPAKAMLGAITPVTRVITPTVSTGRSGGSTASTTPAGPRSFGPYNLTVDGKVLTSIIIDTVTGNPRVVSKASNEGTRRSAWAGSGR